jgi:glycosyltransferase
MSTKISIITINYNNASGLRLTLESLGSQYGADNFECIIVDGGSKDDSKNVILDFSEQFQNLHWVSEPDTGIYNAMNKGLSLSSGEYVGFLNSGDTLFDKNIICEYLAITDQDSSISAIYGDVNYLDPNFKVVREWRSGYSARWKFYFGWMPPHPMTIIKKSVIERLGGFDEDLKIASDYKLLLSAFYKMQIKSHYFANVVVNMEVGGVSNANLLSFIRSNFEVLISWFRVNGLAIPFWIFFTKPLFKINQLFFRRR